MIKLIIKLAIVGVILNGVARAGMVAWGYYQFKDATQQIAVFGAETATSHLHGQVMQKAASLAIPVSEEQVNVRRDGMRTIIEVAYQQPVELFPQYTYTVPVKFDVEGISAGNPLEGVQLP
jgi:hypothetical protein